MLLLIRNQMIRLAFASHTRVIRLKRAWQLRGQPRIGALDHVTIPVRDLGLARRFYCEVLGAAYAMTVDDETFRRFGRPQPRTVVKVRITYRFIWGDRRALTCFCRVQDNRPLQRAIRTSHFMFRLANF